MNKSKIINQKVEIIKTTAKVNQKSKETHFKDLCLYKI
jgi:hypothetical protein